ncbi:MAG: CubicO group peptidase (beta-lactamase class C family) [Saprospiraceae bacterium]|jgi:CubicO group peptidase (beta-lactamase class C family)
MKSILLVVISLLSLVLQITGQDNTIRDVDQYLQEYKKNVPVPGFSVVIVEGNKVKFIKGYGVEQEGSSKAMTPYSTIAINALGRGFTSLAIMQLVEQGLLDLDKPVITYLPWFTTANKEFSDLITLRMCLSNTTGIPPQYESLPDLQSDNAAESFVRSFESHFIKRKPGMTHEFCDEGYVIAGLVLSKVTGMSYGDYIRKHIISPLGMKATSPDGKQLERIKVLYGHELGLEECLPAVPFVTDKNFRAAGSEFYSCAADLGSYLIALLNGGTYKNTSLLSTEGVEELFKPNVSFQGLGTMLGGNGIDIQYTLGWLGMNIEDRDIMIHTSNNGNVASIIGLNRAKNQAFAMLFNADVNNLDRFEYDGMEHTVNNVIHLLNAEDTTDFGIMRFDRPDEEDFLLPQEEQEKYLGTYLAYGKPSPFFKDMTIEISKRQDGEYELLARQEALFKGRYRLDFINESRAWMLNISNPRQVQFSIYPDGFIGGLFMFGSEFKKRNKAQEARFKEVHAPERDLSFRLPSTLDHNWNGNSLIANMTDQENTSFQLTYNALNHSTFQEYIAQQIEGKNVSIKGILNKEVLKKGIWAEQTLVIQEGSEKMQYFIASYQDPVSQKQMQLTLKTPWGKFSTEQQELIKNIRQSVGFSTLE